MVLLNFASLVASTLLFYYTYRFYVLMSDTKLQDALKLLLNGFLLLVLKSVVAIMEDYNYIDVMLAKGDLEGLVALIAYIVIIFSMIKFRRLFIEFEVQKKAISMMRNVFEGRNEPAPVEKKGRRKGK
ncbi:hypothetical protein HY989_03435 [Candidatus Micrarchaeota archaeon]|nr:hypothetical protein [Candidatus Micrarchaeota archaeon]